MTDDRQGREKPAGSGDPRRRRLAEALRRNLRRRKEAVGEPDDKAAEGDRPADPGKA